MKRLLMVLVFASSVFAGAGGDSLVFPSTVTAFADGDTFWVKSQWKPLVDTLLSWGNGRIGNVNFADDAMFDQRKIDSTATLSTDWIHAYTKKLWQWLTGTPTLRSPRGITVQMNDTTANQGTFSLNTDSTKLLFRIGEDTIRTCLPTTIDSSITTGNDSIWVFKSFGSNIITADSLCAGLGMRSLKSIHAGDSLLGDDGARIGNTITCDSLNVTSGIFVSDKIAVGSDATGNVLAEIRKNQASTTSFLISNTNQTAGADAEIRLWGNQTGATVGSDLQLSFMTGSSGTDWGLGLDRSATGSFKISGGSDVGASQYPLGTNDRVIIDASGNTRFTGYTTLGDSAVAPAIKFKDIHANITGDTTSIQLGIGHSKILHVQTLNNYVGAGQGAYFSQIDPWGGANNMQWWIGNKNMMVSQCSEVNDTMWIKCGSNLTTADTVNVLLMYKQ